MTFSAPIIVADVAEADRVGDRAGRDDRALAGHQPRHRRDRAEAAGVGQRDVGADEVVGGERVRARLLDERVVGGEEVVERTAAPASRITGTISVREPSFFSTSTARPRLTCAVVDAVRLAVDLGEVVGHHRHVRRRRARSRRRSGA